MHPLIAQELVKFRMAEQIHDAEQERLARLATSDRPRRIDIVQLGTSLRQRLFGHRPVRPTRSARAGA